MCTWIEQVLNIYFQFFKPQALLVENAKSRFSTKITERQVSIKVAVLFVYAGRNVKCCV